MPGAWCSGGKWRRQNGSLSVTQLIERVVRRYGKSKNECAAIAKLLWEEAWVVLIEDGKVTLPGMRCDLRVKKVIGSEKRYGRRLQRYNIKITPNGQLAARLRAMSEAINTDDSFMDAPLNVPGEQTTNPYYPFKSEASYLEFVNRVNTRVAEKAAQSTVEHVAPELNSVESP